MNAGVLERRVRAALRALGVTRSDTLVVACSGGSDSSALALLCAADACTNLHLAYVRHGLRTAAVEEREIATVAALAARIDARFHATERPSGLPGVTRVGTEAAARAHRYRALAAIAAKIDARAVLTAHHRDDAAETALLWLASGRPIEEFGGIGATVVLAETRVYRPLLAVRRAELARYARARGIEVCVDETNADDRYRRNAVRHALGVLDATHPSLNAALADLGRRVERIAGVTDWALEHAARLTDQLRSATATRWDTTALLALPAALRSSLIRREVYRIDPGDRSSVSGLVREFERAAATTRGRFETWLASAPAFGAVQLGLDRFRIVLRLRVVRTLESGYLFRVAPGSVLRFMYRPRFSRPETVDSPVGLDRVVRIDGLTEPIVCRSTRPADGKRDRRDRFDAIIDDAVGPVARIGPNGVRNLQHHPAADGVSVRIGYAGGYETGK